MAGKKKTEYKQPPPKKTWPPTLEAQKSRSLMLKPDKNSKKRKKTKNKASCITESIFLPRWVDREPRPKKSSGRVYFDGR